MIALDQGKVAEVTHFEIARPFGEATLIIPFRKCDRSAHARSSLTMAIPAGYVRELRPEEVPLSGLPDRTKKVLDTEDRGGRKLSTTFGWSARTALFMSAMSTSAATACSAGSGFEVWPTISTNELTKRIRS